MFNGDENKYELWEVKFLGHMRLQKLHNVIEKPDGETPDNAPSTEKLSECFAELVQYLDDRSLSLVIRDAKNDGRKALTILREHYLGGSKPRVIALYTELTSMRMNDEENSTDYVIKAENAANALKMAGETVSDSLLIAMMLKGLPSRFSTFVTVMTQRQTQPSLTDFKKALKDFEETEKYREPEAMSNSIMKLRINQDREQVKCYTCGRIGHKSPECRSKEKKFRKKRWCENCTSQTHDTKYCRRKDSAKVANSTGPTAKDNESDYFAFKVNTNGSESKNYVQNDCILVDCGATAHIITDESKFISFDERFDPKDHVIELADGSRSSGIVAGRGNAKVNIYDVNGNPCKFLLQDALYIPSYSQDIFSVQAATSKGASVRFNPNCAELRAPNGITFDVTKRGRLYYLNNVSSVSKKNCTRSLAEWHRILGHCNFKDVKNLERVVDGMKIGSGNVDLNCETCITGKMSQYRSREPDRRATKPLEFVHCDLAGPIEPVAKDGYRYCISFVDDYSGAIKVYFLKNKSDSANA